LSEVTVVVKLPSDIRIPPGELEKRVRAELAVRLYQKRIVSLGQARRIAGLSKWEFLDLLAREKVPLHYTEEDLREDMEAIRELK